MYWLGRLLWILCLDSFISNVHSDQDRCEYVAETEKLKLNNYEFDELHIRHNLKVSE